MAMASEVSLSMLGTCRGSASWLLKLSAVSQNCTSGVALSCSINCITHIFVHICSCKLVSYRLVCHEAISYELVGVTLIAYIHAQSDHMWNSCYTHACQLHLTQWLLQSQACNPLNQLLGTMYLSYDKNIRHHVLMTVWSGPQLDSSLPPWSKREHFLRGESQAGTIYRLRCIQIDICRVDGLTKSRDSTYIHGTRSCMKYLNLS